jgi:hypothetical protein
MFDPVELMQALWPNEKAWSDAVVEMWGERLDRISLNAEQFRAVLGQCRMDGLNPHSSRGQKRESDANQILARLHRSQEPRPAKATRRDEPAPAAQLAKLTVSEVDERIADATALGWPAWIIAAYRDLRVWIETGEKPRSLRIERMVGGTIGRLDAPAYEGDIAGGA